MNREDLAVRRHAAVSAALQVGREEAIRVLWRFRRAALRAGDIEEAADCLAVLWSLNLTVPERQLSLARRRAREAPTAASFLDLGHAFVISDRADEARRAYEQAIGLATRSPPHLRRFEQAAARDARSALRALNAGRSIPFVESARRLASEPDHEEERVHWEAEATNAPSANAFQRLALVYESAGRLDRAAAAYAKAIKCAENERNRALAESLDAKLRILRRSVPPKTRR